MAYYALGTWSLLLEDKTRFPFAYSTPILTTVFSMWHVHTSEIFFFEWGTIKTCQQWAQSCCVLYDANETGIPNSGMKAHTTEKNRTVETISRLAALWGCTKALQCLELSATNSLLKSSQLQCWCSVGIMSTNLLTFVEGQNLPSLEPSKYSSFLLHTTSCKYKFILF